MIVGQFTIWHPSAPISLRNWKFRSAYRTGYEDWEEDQTTNNPYPRTDARWAQYERGNKDARRQNK